MNQNYCEESINEFRYVPVPGGIKIVAYAGVKDYIKIPREIDGKTVVEIGVSAEDYEYEIACGVLIPSTVRHIDIRAVNSPDNGENYYTGIKNKAGWFTDFSLESGNSSLVLKDNFLIEGGKTLVYCTDFTAKEIAVPEGVEIIGSYAFRDCCGVEKLYLPDGLKVIEDHAFDGCRLREVKLPVGLEKIGVLAFNGYIYNLSESFPLRLTVPLSVKELGASYFVKFPHIEKNSNFTVCDGFLMTADKKTVIMYVGEEVLELRIPDYVENIAPYACSVRALRQIRKLVLGSSLKSIGAHAFGMNKVQSLKIPAGVEYIDDTAFNFKSVRRVSVDKNNPNFYTDKTALYRKQDGKLVLMYCFDSGVEEYTVADNTVRICKGAFGHCSALENLILPHTLQEFSEECLGENVKKIFIPASVSNIEFSKQRSELEYEIDSENKAYFIKDSVIYKNTEEGIVAVHYNGNVYGVTLLDGTVAVAPYAFTKKLTMVTVPGSVRRIEHHAFYGCGLSTVNLREGTEFIDYAAFMKNKIERVHLPASVKYVSTSAFSHCQLYAYTVAEKSKTYAVCDDALYSKDMTVLYDVPAMKESEDFTVSAHTVEICRAFCGCEYIGAIRLPLGIKNLWRKSIVGSRELTDIYFEKSPDYISPEAINCGYYICLHGELDTPVALLVDRMSAGGLSKLVLAVKGTENIRDFSREYMLSSNKTGLTIIRRLWTKGNTVIPSEVNGHKITAIAARAFAEDRIVRENLETVEIPDTVKVIGEGAFFNCKKLTDVILPERIEEIPDRLFFGCENLKGLVIPDGVKRIGESALFGCSSLAEVYVPESVEFISEWVFAEGEDSFTEKRNKDARLNIYAQYTVRRGSYAERFLKAYEPERRCGTDRLLVVPEFENTYFMSEEDARAIEYLEFRELAGGKLSVKCKPLYGKNDVDISIPETFRGMPVVRLSGMGKIDSGLRSLYIPKTVTCIDDLYHLSFMLGGIDMEKITVAQDNPNYWSDGQALYSKDKSILIHMFDYQAEEYEIQKETKIIAEGAFGSFSHLTRLVLPGGLQKIQKKAFFECNNLSEIDGIEKIQNIAEDALDTTAYYYSRPVIYCGNVLHRCSIADTKRYVIPDGTTEIARNAFFFSGEADMLEEIVIPPTVRRIGEEAFFNRRKLSQIRIPEGIEKLEKGVFKGCESLQSLYIPASVKEISYTAFPIMERTSGGIHISPVFSSVEVAEENPFYKSVNGVLYSRDGKTLIKVPAHYDEEEFTVPDSVEVIGSGAFMGSLTVKRVVLTPNVVRICEKAFFECKELEYINTENVRTIGKEAFYGCFALKRVKLTAEEIAEKAFFSCSDLDEVILEGTVKIDSSAFCFCKSLRSVSLPEGLKEIGNSAFADCALKQAVIPKTVEIIGYESFAGCADVTVYDSITPDAKGCEERRNYLGGTTDSLVGFIGIGPSRLHINPNFYRNWTDHEITVRSAETDEIKYKVWMGAERGQRSYLSKVTSAWGRNATFNFPVLDALFPEIRGKENKLRTALNRLRYPEMLTGVQRAAYIEYLVKQSQTLVTYCIDSDDMESLLMCEPFGILKKYNIDGLIDYAVNAGATQFSSYLMNYKFSKLGLSGTGLPRL